MLAIMTKSLGSTNHRPARIKAYTANGRRHTISYDYDGMEKAHIRAARELALKIDADHIKRYGVSGPWGKATFTSAYMDNDTMCHINAASNLWRVQE